MAEKKCLICSKSFYVKPSHLKRGWGKYCSAECRTKSQFNGKSVSCFICKKGIYRSAKDLRNSDSGNFFCSKSCQTLWRNSIVFVGKNHSNWLHGRSAYRRILEKENTEKVCLMCKIKDKRVMIVHHIDKNRENNDVKNLVWLCNNCHYLVHHYLEEQKRLSTILKE